MRQGEEQIDESVIKELETICSEKKTHSMFNKIIGGEYFKNPTYAKLKSLYLRVEEFYLNVKAMFEKVEIEKFFANTIDIEGLKEIYVKKGLSKLYPNLDFDKLVELYKNPPTSLKSPAYRKHIIYDKVIVRKYIIGIIQMVFNNMDLVITFCGREGTGKTTASTQDAFLVHHLIKEFKIVEQEFTLKNTMYYNLKSIIAAFNKFSRNPFKIFVLDEGNELNRREWSNPLVQLFFQKLRRERKHLRIIFINLPQLGELMPSLTLSRVNFVFQLDMRFDLKTKLAEKGKTKFFIIPRFNKVYSYFNKKDLYQDYVINEMGKILDDKKKYLQLLPNYLCVHEFERNGVWSFNELEYDKLSKEANEQFSTNSVNMTRNEIYWLGKHMDLKKMGVKPGSKAYHVLAHLKNKKIGVALKGEEYQNFVEQDDGESMEAEG